MPQASISNNHRHLLPAGASIAPAAPLCSGQKAARRCPCCNVGCLLQPKLRPFCARCHTDTHWLYIKMGFTGYPLRFRCRQPRAVLSRSLRCVGRFYFQAESSTAKVSLHYSVNREMRLPSTGTAMLGGLHGSCQGVPRAASPSCPQQTGQAGETLPLPARPDLRAGPACAMPRWPDVAIGSCSWFLQPRVSQYLFLPFTVFSGCCCTPEPFRWLKHGLGAGAGRRRDPDLVLFPFVPLK